ncbi:hypothetical protein SAMN04489740_4077 [Arthrobacter alpinus]|uniref:WxL domain-containing protein n=1 Tax=Arthrobacter alpinus TaxID=656366 RepID=A0A1H5PBC5_9MICC|nr:hypothetical protein [Arthrobacter alpinus]SEF11189.1 hypothetical protein SAMN04489740_4077 [Arthrobacter alpinus]
MRKKAIVMVIAAGWVVGGLAIAGPAQADTIGGTPITIQVTGGPLNISVPAGPVSLGSVGASLNAQTVTADLGIVGVTDVRAGTAGWVVTASAVDFTGPQNISVSEPGLSSYTPSSASVIGVATVTGTNLDALYPGGVVETATAVTGVNSATWHPSISVTIPADALAGTYSSVLTHSVS